MMQQVDLDIANDMKARLELSKKYIMPHTENV